ncbi:hypothetical protein [Actinoplanes sp. HUAS TT8]|uniref:hypothetical protein n=1 Tax=Actinoplanes sp. HUAS TT8 TaxID=3447453 RepID=UPI003F520AB1
MRLSRRRLMLVALGAAAGAAGCSGPPGNVEPPAPSASPDPSLLRDDIADGITVEDRGFSTFQVPGLPATRRIVGAAGVFRNTTSQPMKIHVRFRFVDDAGRGWHSQESNDWAAVLNAGWGYLPPGQAVEFGDVDQVDAADADRVAGIVMYVIALPAAPSILLPAKIVGLKPRPTPKDEWDYVSFEVDCPLIKLEEPNFGLVYRSPEGRLIGGWFVYRANFIHLKDELPKGETDEYRQGTSRHTLPVVLPPGIQPGAVTMYLWPS